MEENKIKLKILALDDDNLVRKILKKLFSDLYDIVTIETYEDFKNIILSFKPDILLLDLTLKNSNGIDICRELRSSDEYKDLIIIILTASDEVKIVTDCYQAGADDFLRKSFLLYELKPKLEIFEKMINSKKQLKSAFTKIRDINENHKGELNKIRQVQASIMPDFKEIRGYDISSTFLPAIDLSGDFYDGYFINENIYQIVLCDISGHGIASSYIGNQVRILFRIASTSERSLSEIADIVNLTLCDDLAGLYYFGTVNLIQIDLNKNVIKFLSAGHPEALKYDSGQSQVVKYKNTGPLIGLVKDAKFTEVTIEMNPNDLLLLYTDGIVEFKHKDDFKEMFGVERLIEVFVKNKNNSSQDILLSIINELYLFSDASFQDDDITAICIKRN